MKSVPWKTLFLLLLVGVGTWFTAMCTRTGGSELGDGANARHPRALLRIHSETNSVLAQPTRLSTEDYARLQKTQETLIRSRRVLAAALGQTKVSSLPMWTKIEDPIAWTNDHMVVSFDGEIMSVTLNGGEPSDQAIIVNSIVDTYKSTVVDVAYFERRNEYQKLSDLKEKVKQQLTSARVASAAARRSTTALSPHQVELESRLFHDKTLEIYRRILDQEMQMAAIRVQRSAAASPAEEDIGAKKKIHELDEKLAVLGAQLQWLKSESSSLAEERARFTKESEGFSETDEEIALLEDQTRRLSLRLQELEANLEAPVGVELLEHAQ